MKRKFMVRYLILITALVICTCVAWYLTNAPQAPAEDAVLAALSGNGRTERICSREIWNGPAEREKGGGAVWSAQRCI